MGIMLGRIYWLKDKQKLVYQVKLHYSHKIEGWDMISGYIF